MTTKNNKQTSSPPVFRSVPGGVVGPGGEFIPRGAPLPGKPISPDIRFAPGVPVGGGGVSAPASPQASSQETQVSSGAITVQTGVPVSVAAPKSVKAESPTTIKAGPPTSGFSRSLDLPEQQAERFRASGQIVFPSSTSFADGREVAVPSQTISLGETSGVSLGRELFLGSSVLPNFSVLGGGEVAVPSGARVVGGQSTPSGSVLFLETYPSVPKPSPPAPVRLPEDVIPFTGISLALPSLPRASRIPFGGRRLVDEGLASGEKRARGVVEFFGEKVSPAVQARAKSADVFFNSRELFQTVGGVSTDFAQQIGLLAVDPGGTFRRQPLTSTVLVGGSFLSAAGIGIKGAAVSPTLFGAGTKALQVASRPEVVAAAAGTAAGVFGVSQQRALVGTAAGVGLYSGTFAAAGAAGRGVRGFVASRAPVTYSPTKFFSVTERVTTAKGVGSVSRAVGVTEVSRGGDRFVVLSKAGVELNQPNILRNLPRYPMGSLGDLPLKGARRLTGYGSGVVDVSVYRASGDRFVKVLDKSITGIDVGLRGKRLFYQYGGGKAARAISAAGNKVTPGGFRGVEVLTDRSGFVGFRGSATAPLREGTQTAQSLFFGKSRAVFSSPDKVLRLGVIRESGRAVARLPATLQPPRAPPRPVVSSKSLSFENFLLSRKLLARNLEAAQKSYVKRYFSGLSGYNVRAPSVRLDVKRDLSGVVAAESLIGVTDVGRVIYGVSRPVFEPSRLVGIAPPSVISGPPLVGQVSRVGERFVVGASPSFQPPVQIPRLTQPVLTSQIPASSFAQDTFRGVAFRVPSVQVPLVTTEPAPFVAPPPLVPFVPAPPFVPPPFVPVGLPLLGGGGVAPVRRQFFRRARRTLRYSPDIASGLFGIVGTPKRTTNLTGFELRPVPVGKKKKKKKTTRRRR